jgi:glycine/D-amino acid oxidase-like deaminating enzyme
MKRIYGAYAYSDAPRSNCWWDQTVPPEPERELTDDQTTDVAIIGAGFTGLSAAYHLAQKGVRVTVLDAHFPGWGASGRNGGFCCLGGSKADDASLDSEFGKTGRLAYRQAEREAVELVASLIRDLTLDVDQHSDGETAFAHRRRDMMALRAQIAPFRENYGADPVVIERNELALNGMDGPFFGGLTLPIGFALNPAKYLAGLLRAATGSGALVFHKAPVSKIDRNQGKFVLRTPLQSVTANQVIIATNGYSSDDLPDWLNGRYIPTQSNVLVTRPITNEEKAAQGWTSRQMGYDTRNLLHYFRLMPDNRFLFGMHGGIFTGQLAENAARRQLCNHFRKMFPKWSKVSIQNSWSGMVCVARDKTPFAGAVPGSPGMWAGLCYHGNGVAMGTYVGRLLSDLITDGRSDAYPAPLERALRRFPVARARRIFLPPLYAYFRLRDF